MIELSVHRSQLIANLVLKTIATVKSSRQIEFLAFTAKVKTFTKIATKASTTIQIFLILATSSTSEILAIFTSPTKAWFIVDA
jgi:hypothetical protein